MGRYGADNALAKAARHFSQVLDGKLSSSLRCSGYIIFGWGTKSLSLKFSKYRHFGQKCQI